MKKLLLLIATVAAAFTASAQDFTLKSGETVLKDGDRVNITDMVDLETWELFRNVLTFEPEISLTTPNAGSATVTVAFLSNECSPELSGEDADFNWLNGVGDASLTFCSETFCGNCFFISVGNDLAKTASVKAGAVDELLIHLGYTIGTGEKEISDVDIKAEFSVKVEQGGETMTCTFYVDTKGNGGIGSTIADENVPVEYFDLQGRRVLEPTTGLYIKRQGSKTTKVIL